MTIIRKEKSRKEKGVSEEKSDVPLTLAHGRSGACGGALDFMRRHTLG